MKVPSELVHGQQFQNDFAKDPLPAVADPRPPRLRNDAVKGIKHRFLLRINHLPHGIDSRNRQTPNHTADLNQSALYSKLMNRPRWLF